MLHRKGRCETSRLDLVKAHRTAVQVCGQILGVAVNIVMRPGQDGSSSSSNSSSMRKVSHCVLFEEADLVTQLGKAGFTKAK